MLEIEGYQAKNLIYEGKRSKLFRASSDPGGSVIIKVAQNPRDELHQRRLRHEFEVGRRVYHPCVIGYLDLLNSSHGTALVMEDNESQALMSGIPEGGMETPLFLELALRLVDGLSAIHEEGIVHRNIAPDHILYNGESMKFIDFSASCLMVDKVPVSNLGTPFWGSLLYMAPEQTVHMQQTLDFRADFYSLGMTFYHMLAGIPAFDSYDFLELVHCHLAKIPSPLHELRATIPSELSAVIARLIEKDVDDRYQSIDQLKDDLEAFRRKLAWAFSEPEPIGRARRRDTAASLPAPVSAPAETGDGFLALSDPVQRLLHLAACIGRGFDLGTLAHLAGQAEEDLRISLRVAVGQGFLTVVGRDQPASVNQRASLSKLFFKFLREADWRLALELDSPQANEKIHLRIGRFKLLRSEDLDYEGTLFEVIGHFQKCRGLVTDSAERRRLARLYMEAGIRIRDAFVYVLAIEYFRTGLAFIAEEDRESNHRLSFEMRYEISFCAFRAGDLAQAESETGHLLGLAKTNMERARVYQLRLLFLTFTKARQKAIAEGITALALLGVRINGRPNRLTLLVERFRLRLNLRRTPLKHLKQLPFTNDPKHQMIMKLLNNMNRSSYLEGNGNLFKLLLLKRVRGSLIFGHCPDSMSGLISYGNLLGISSGNFRAGAKIGRTVLELTQRMDDPGSQGRVFFLYAIYIYGWTEHWRGITPFLKRALELSLRSGDLSFSAFTCAYIHYWNPDIHLKQAVRESKAYLSIVNRAGFWGRAEGAKIFLQFFLCLRGKTKDYHSLNGPGFDEEECLDNLRADGMTVSRASFHLKKLQLHLLFEDVAAGYRQWQLCRKYIHFLTGTLHMVEWSLFTGLLFARRFPELEGRDRKSALKKVRYETGKMARWARQCPVNFKHLWLLLKAELAAMKGRRWLAETCFEASIAAAGSQGFLVYEALANERAGKFYLKENRFKMAGIHLHKAAELYERWGSRAQKRYLEQNYGQWFPDLTHFARFYPKLTAVRIGSPFEEAGENEGFNPLGASFSLGSGSHGPDGEALDLVSVAKASLALSREINLARLLAKLMKITIESAGAQRGLLVGNEGGRFLVEAAADVGDGKVKVLDSEPLELHENAPKGIIRYVFRTGGQILLRDASREGLFVNNPYVQKNQSKSILCLPLSLQQRITGVLFLENNLITNAFSKERAQVLSLLLAQAAVSLENARLYRDITALNQALGRQAEERKVAEKEVRVLNEALEERVKSRTEALRQAQRELVEKAHQAGMADIAGSVLHNVGNILTSVITSGQLILETLTRSRLKGLKTANSMVLEHQNDLESFLFEDPKGRDLVQYFFRLGDVYQKERLNMTENVQRLADMVYTIKDVLVAQESYAAGGFQDEPLVLSHVVEEALAIQDSSFARHQIRVEKNYGRDSPIFVQKVKLMHVIINLLKNAKEAMSVIDPAQKLLVITVDSNQDWVFAGFKDSGVGIEISEMSHIFTQGYSTKPGSHGLGLHGCAQAMNEMKGVILVESEGRGKGACFTLRFPVNVGVEKLVPP